MLFNTVFALQAQASHSVVKCYYDLSKRLISLISLAYASVMSNIFQIRIILDWVLPCDMKKKDVAF